MKTVVTFVAGFAAATAFFIGVARSRGYRHGDTLVGQTMREAGVFTIPDGVSPEDAVAAMRAELGRQNRLARRATDSE